MIGTTLSRYRITAKLGEGGMGSVWRAEDTLLGRDVALKLLAPHLAASDDARQRFIREARAASRLEHAGIATVYDAGEADGLVFIAYQLIEGVTLAARLAAGPLTLPELLRMARGTAEALAHAHGRDVLHRDLTAGNVMLRPDGAPVIVDFGLARTHGDVTLTRTGTTLGTAPYLAPEQWRGEHGDARTDLWSLGVVLYYAATALQPFGADAQEAVMYRVLNDEPAKPMKLRPELPVEFEHLVMRLLEKDASDRLASAGELAGALQGIASGDPLSVSASISGDTPVARMRRWWHKWARQRFGPAHVAGSVGLAGLLVALMWLGAKQGWLPWADKEREVIAVLAFENISADAEDAGYLSEGLGQELVAKLGEGSGYRVLPWPTTRRFSATRHSLREIARELHATALLLGSFRSEDGRIRVTASLVDGRSGLQRWGRAFDETSADLMSIQVNIALGVASRLEGTLAASVRTTLERRPTTNPEAYEYYLRGANFFQAADAATRALAIPHFEKALELAPTLAEAHVGRGAVYVDGYFRGEPGGREHLRLARADFERALMLHPGMPRAQRGLVSVDYETGQIEDMYRLAVDVAKRGDDDIEGLLTRAWAFSFGGLPEEALPLFERILQLDPQNREGAWFRVFTLAWSCEYELCIQRGKEFIRQFGEDPEVYTWMALSASESGKLQDGVLFAERASQIFSDDDSDLYFASVAANVFARAADQARLRALLEHWTPIMRHKLLAAPDNIRPSVVLAALESAGGRKEQSQRELDAALRLVATTPGNSNVVIGLVCIPAASGDLPRLHRAIDIIRHEDLAVARGLFDYSNVGMFVSRATMVAIEAIPAFASLRKDIGARCDQLRRDYVPIVGLRARPAGTPQASPRRTAP